MRFNHYGKTYQLRIETARDLADVLELDESLWVATSAPVTVFRCDETFTRFLDRNQDGRISTHEVRNAIRWLLDNLKDTSRLAEGSVVVRLDALRTEGAQAGTLLNSARYILRMNGGDQDTIALSNVRGFLNRLRQQPMNGDSVIVAAAAPNDETAQYIRDIIVGLGGTDDISGEKGVTENDVKEFQDRVTAYLDWIERGGIPEGAAETPLMPFGNDTPALYQLFHKHADRIDFFFGFCRAIHFDARTSAHVGCTTAELNELELNSLDDLQACLRLQPIARPNEAAQLPLHENAVNPLYRDWIGELKAKVLAVALKKEIEFLEEADWQLVKTRFSPYAAYLSDKPAGQLDQIPIERLRSYVRPSFQEAARDMIKADRNVTLIRDGARNLEQFLLYHQYLLRFVNNFVNFHQLYALDETAIFEMGAAVIDGRWFSMALKVDDIAAHQQLAATSNIFTLYVEVSGPPAETPFLVAIPATWGAKGNLCVGKRGIFFDTENREYNARIVKIIENPISVREALLSPFVRLWSFVIGKIERMAGASETALQKETDTLIAAPSSPAAQAANGPTGMLVGLSLSAAAIGSSVAFVAGTIVNMSYMQRLSSLIGAILVVATPVTLIAIIKLRRQDLSSLLEGCGWAINARMRFNRAQRRQFTRRAALPKGASVDRRPLLRPLFLLAILLILVLIVVYLYGQP